MLEELYYRAEEREMHYRYMALARHYVNSRTPLSVNLAVKYLDLAHKFGVRGGLI